MALLIKPDLEQDAHWERALRACDPGIDLRLWPDAGDPAEIDYALVWAPPPGVLKRCSNLKVIFSTGAGIDHLSSDPELPRHVPVVRMIEPALTAGMTEFVVMSVIYHHRRMLDFAEQRRKGIWAELAQVPPWERRVGIMGLGVLGLDAAEKLKPFGFKLSGWSRSAKQVPGMTCHHGAAGLEPFLAESEIVICLLPLTPDTEGILNARTLAALPKGAAVINVARGGHLVDEDLLAALDSGHLSGATLDVFRQEPLPRGHRFWTHPRIFMTPHVASMAHPDTAARAVIDNIRRFEAGQPMDGVVTWDRGY